MMLTLPFLNLRSPSMASVKPRLAGSSLSSLPQLKLALWKPMYSGSSLMAPVTCARSYRSMRAVSLRNLLMRCSETSAG